jgi:serine/threonine protein kinase
MIRAMKTMKKSSLIKEEEERMFAEMNILKSLDHPNVIYNKSIIFKNLIMYLNMFCNRLLNFMSYIKMIIFIILSQSNIKYK